MDIVVFAEDWGRHPSSTQHILRQMIIQGHRVIWFNSIGLRNPSLSSRDVKRLFAKLFSALGMKKEDGRLSTDVVDDGSAPVKIIHPLVFPKPSNGMMRYANKRILGDLVRREMKTAGMRSPILWITTPSAECITDAVPFKKIVYYCCDDYGDLPGVDPAFVMRLEERLCKSADKIIVTNNKLAVRFPQEKTAYIPHGVDFDLFTAKRKRPADMPPSPVAGYYGSISKWVDVDLLCKVAKQLPQWNFVLIGRVETDVSQMESLNNVFLLGPREHSELVSYSGNWDVSLMPFLQCEQIDKCNPLKLREYLAAGKPVVSVTFPAVKEYEDVVQLVDYGDAEGFACQIRRALQEGEKPEVRSRRVANESWAQRVLEIESFLTD